MAISKVILNNTTLVDMTDATAKQGQVVLSQTAYGADGQKMTGTRVAITNDIYVDADGFVNFDGAAYLGGAVLASGTWTGTGGYAVDLPMGSRMPQTNFGFIMRLISSSETETDDSDYAAISYYFTVYEPDYFDFSSTGTKKLSSTYTFSTNYNETVTSLSPKLSCGTVIFYKGTNTSSTQVPIYNNLISFDKSNSGFTAKVTLWNSKNFFPSGETYEWKLIYFGSNPDDDIVEVS